METIKELEKELANAESCDEVDTKHFQADTEVKIRLLKDVLELIDEVANGGNLISADELKARIEG